MFFEELVSWFTSVARPFPWRENPTPYRVWISEVMLQQTRASVVIPYFLRWVKELPDVRTLASSSLDRVLKLWEGLGYYSRARNLHRAARDIVSRFNGELPEGEKELSSIVGLGPYTVGAIRSFAFHRRAAALDGNVIRVLSRLLAFQEDISQLSSVRTLRSHLLQLLPKRTPAPWKVMEALIELGATICSKNSPLCSDCPLKRECKAHLLRKEELFPKKKRKMTYEKITRFVPVVWDSEKKRLLVQRGKRGKVMADLYEFPYFALESSSEKFSLTDLEARLCLSLLPVKNFPTIWHSFTRFRVQLFAQLFGLRERRDTLPEFLFWEKLSDLKERAFSSGHRRIFLHIIDSL